MVNSNELLYVVDEFDVKIDPQPRHKVFKEGLWRRTTHVWIINKKKSLCNGDRTKTHSPGLWELCPGHMGPDDNYYTGAVREVWEETGLSINPSDLKLLKSIKITRKRIYWCILL